MDKNGRRKVINVLSPEARSPGELYVWPEPEDGGDEPFIQIGLGSASLVPWTLKALSKAGLMERSGKSDAEKPSSGPWLHYMGSRNTGETSTAYEVHTEVELLFEDLNSPS